LLLFELIITFHDYIMITPNTFRESALTPQHILPHMLQAEVIPTTIIHCWDPLIDVFFPDQS